MLQTIIIDDENKAVKAISLILKHHCSEINVIGTANSVDEAIPLINSLEPDVIFLDIEMPEANGFDLLERIPDRKFDVIFITAYNHYAIKAIKYSAFDYILKPIDIEEIQIAVKKIARKRSHNINFNEKFKVLFENIRSDAPNKIAIPVSDGIQYLNIRNIVRVEADRSYSTFYLTDNTKIIVSKSLKEFADVLEGDTFYRAHRSHLININFITRHIKQDGGHIILADGTQIPLSRQKKDDFVKAMERFLK